MDKYRTSLGRCRWSILVLVVLVLLSTLQRPVSAKQATGSLRLDCHVNVDDRKIPLADDTYAIVKIADITVEGNPIELTYQVTQDFKDFSYEWDKLDNEARRQAALELETYVKEHPQLITRTGVTDEDGVVGFSKLEPALYLVSRIQVDVANQACTMDPLLVSVPTVVNDTLEYNLNAVPKYDYQSVSIRPCNVTIYMGGNHGYDAVDGDETTSLPKPMFVIQAPEGMEVEDLTLLYYDDPNTADAPGKRYEWTPVEIGVDEEGNTCYRLDRTDGTNENFHIQYYVDGEAVQADSFLPELEEELYKMYQTGIPLSEGEILVAYQKKADGVTFYPVQRGTAELTVRGVERDSILSNPDNPVTRILEEGETIPQIPAGVGIVAAQDDTTFTLNETNIRLENLHGEDTEMDVGLLFDDIMNEVYDRQSVLEAQADARMPELEEGATRYFQSQYLDLVDMNNGNAWVMASQNVEIYWGYPEGTDENTNFTLWHFPGLHRDGTDDTGASGYDLEDIYAVEPEKVEIENTSQGIRFTVRPGGFSPFVLIWEEHDGTSSDPGSQPSTGDTARLNLWVGLFAVALGGMALTLSWKRKHNL